MKLEHFALLLLVCLFAAACPRAGVETTNRSEAGAANQSAAEAGERDVEGRNSNVSHQTNAPSPGKTAETTDFTGTAGVTEKKYDLRATAVLKAVRAAAHEGYDRVVFEFEGAEMPSYHIEYIDRPVRACGSGDVVPLAGDGWLEIRFTPAAAHTENGAPTVTKRALTPNLKIIKELKATCDFEAETEWVLGVASPNKYRVLELKNPTRLAIDVRQ